jgi:hypothetical protein
LLVGCPDGLGKKEYFYQSLYPKAVLFLKDHHLQVMIHLSGRTMGKQRLHVPLKPAIIVSFLNPIASTNDHASLMQCEIPWGDILQN